MKTYNLRKKTTDIGRSAARICSARIMSACFRARVNHAKAKNPTISGSRTSQSWKRCAPVPSSSFLTIPKKVMYITRYAKNTSGITIGIQALGFLIRELIVMGVLLLNVSIYMYLLNLLGKGYLSMVCMIKKFSSPKMRNGQFVFAPKIEYKLVAERSEANLSNLQFPTWCRGEESNLQEALP